MARHTTEDKIVTGGKRMLPKVGIGEETCQFTIVAGRITFLKVIFEFNQKILKITI